jgi:hypothetical protein
MTDPGNAQKKSGRQYRSLGKITDEREDGAACGDFTESLQRHGSHLLGFSCLLYESSGKKAIRFLPKVAADFTR